MDAGVKFARAHPSQFEFRAVALQPFEAVMLARQYPSHFHVEHLERSAPCGMKAISSGSSPHLNPPVREPVACDAGFLKQDLRIGFHPVSPTECCAATPLEIQCQRNRVLEATGFAQSSFLCPFHIMKSFRSFTLAANLLASASAATLYTDSGAFLNSSTWSGAPAGAAFTENFAASGGLHNFTGSEQFSSNSYTYGSGSLQNTVTYARTDSGDIYVDTTNESGGFLSFDNPGTLPSSSKYLYVPANGGGDGITISFSQPITAFGFRIGDFGDPSGDVTANKWSSLVINSRNALNSSITNLVYAPFVDVSKGTGGNNIFDTLYLDDLYVDPKVIIGDKRWFFMGWTFDSPINRIQLHQGNGNNDSWGVDTVSFVTVPEPSAAALSALGVGVLIRRRRVREAAA